MPFLAKFNILSQDQTHLKTYSIDQISKQHTFLPRMNPILSLQNLKYIDPQNISKLTLPQQSIDHDSHTISNYASN